MRDVTLVPLLLLASAGWLLAPAHAASATGRTVASGDRPRRDQHHAACSVDLTEDLAEKEPLILQKQCTKNVCSWKLSEGDEDQLNFERGEEVLIACPDKNNELQGFASQTKSVVAVCSDKPDSSFKVNGEAFTIKGFECERIPKGEIMTKNVACGHRNAELMELGFTVRDQWYSLIKVCHVKARSETLFTEHILQGETTKKRRIAKRPSFEEGGCGCYQGFSANDAYKNVNKTLREVTGSSKFPSSISSNIDRGHLAPDGDFPITPYRYATYFYVNAVPMWSVINRGNWVALEDKIRKLARDLATDLHIATGVFRVMDLPDRNGNLQELFLYRSSNRKQIPVPKFLWKVVYDEKSKKGIAFVVLNDPFPKAIDSDDELCPNICKESGWNDNRWRRISRGYLYCCEVKELKKFVPYVPKYDVKSVLNGSD
ncbi:hypothetical protein R5R35_013850 [Gryllus longicercus]|uniref:DNA/RNA non-specific endonuclease domain-containing protein n=1 Tax=Gryllus longicercus TaxID=2509291 RepID=A0AAN9V6D7_9ORTH